MNGATALVEPNFRARTITVEFAISSRGAEDTPENHGSRHLLEHLLARGRNRDLDSKLERLGGFLRASTYRDLILFEISVPPDEFKLALDVVAELIRPPKIDQALINAELPVLAEEFALTEPSQKLIGAAWDKAYGPAGLNPLGTAQALAKSTPDSLFSCDNIIFRSSNLTLSVTGPVTLDGAMAQCVGLLSRVPAAEKANYFLKREPITPVSVASDGGFALGMPVPSYREPDCVAALAAALAWASESEGNFVSYTPTSRSSLVVCGSEKDGPSKKGKIQKLTEGDFARWWSYAKGYAQGWLLQQMEAGNGSRLRAMMLSLGPDDSPEKLRVSIDALEWPQFRAACQKLQLAAGL